MSKYYKIPRKYYTTDDIVIVNIDREPLNIDDELKRQVSLEIQLYLFPNEAYALIQELTKELEKVMTEIDMKKVKPSVDASVFFEEAEE